MLYHIQINKKLKIKIDSRLNIKINLNGKVHASQPSQKELKINNHFILFPNSRLGSGAFGQIFKGVNIKTKEDVAIKIESTNIKTPQLLHQYKILKILKDGEGFPQIYLFTHFNDTLVMVMKLMGDNLEILLQNQKCANEQSSNNTKNTIYAR